MSQPSCQFSPFPYVCNSAQGTEVNIAGIIGPIMSIYCNHAVIQIIKQLSKIYSQHNTLRYNKTPPSAWTYPNFGVPAVPCE